MLAFKVVLSVTILETTKTKNLFFIIWWQFYRSQFWRLQKHSARWITERIGFIGHNFGDYKNSFLLLVFMEGGFIGHNFGDYKNKFFSDLNLFLVLSVTILETTKTYLAKEVYGLEFYRSQFWRLQKHMDKASVLARTFYRSQFWRLQKPQMVSSNYTIKVRSYSAWKAEQLSASPLEEPTLYEVKYSMLYSTWK